ncbi:MAG: zinc ribbon domain-containing protein [Candidatus Thorarchaeota archaeon]
MGDFTIPGAPFVFSLPDNWTVVQSTMSSGANCIIAMSPEEEIEVVYHIYTASSIDEVLADPNPKILTPFCTDIRFTLNGMDCLIYNGLTTDDFMALLFWEAGPEYGTFYGMPNAVDLTVAFVENQGVVLKISIVMGVQSHEFSEHPALLVISGVQPGSPTLTPDEDPFEATAVSPIESHRRQITLPTKPITHKDVRISKGSTKKSEFKALLDLLAQQKPQIWALSRLKAISDSLKGKREYGSFSEDLDTIREMLKKQWGITDSSEDEIKFKARKPVSATPPSASTPKTKESPPPVPAVKERESKTSCRKCESPLQPTDKFCRECGTQTKTKPRRWSPTD